MKKIFCFICLAFAISGCKKYLDAKTDKQLVVPATLNDAQALLDNYTRLNNSYPYSASVSDDDFYLADTYYAGLTTAFQNLYTWNKDLTTDNDWNGLYSDILYTNLALETVESIQPTSATLNDWKRLKGTALFLRSYALFLVAEYYSEPYSKSEAASKQGIPLRLQSDVNVPDVRSSMQETYAQITGDLSQAATLLPINITPLSRPSRAAAFALLARVYVSMEEYTLAGKFADSSLQLNSTLLNYNNLDVNAAAPFTRFNAEVIFPSVQLLAGSQSVTNWRADSVLYQSYNTNDLRKKLFFKTNGSGTALYYGFKGSYDGITAGTLFNGLATDEMYLIRSECNARLANTIAAINDLNALLITRWKTGTFVPYTAINSDDALIKILAERRRELLARGMRWFDLRRLNKDTRFAKTLLRQISGVTFQLPPNDPRYTFYIPAGVIALNGMQQNNR
jgi:hypothetical protein